VGVFAQTQPSKPDLINLAKTLNQYVTELNADLLDGDTSITAHLIRMQQTLNQFRTAA